MRTAFPKTEAFEQKLQQHNPTTHFQEFLEVGGPTRTREA